MAEKSNTVLSPNLGLYFDRSPLSLGPRALADGYNFRIHEGKLSNLNLGWDQFENFGLNGPVTLVKNFLRRDGVEKLILGTPSDLYAYDPNTSSVVFITPRYETGTASAAGTTVTGVGTTWTGNVASGDEISFGAAGVTNPNATWYTIANVGGDTTLTLSTSAGTVANGPYTIRTKFTGETRDVWVTDIFVYAEPEQEDQFWATNGVDSIVRWNGDDDQVEVMSALGFTAKVLGVYANMMIFANVTQAGEDKSTDIINSDVGRPADVSTGLAGQFKVHGGTDEILSLEPMGDNLVIYSRDTPVLCQFQGDPLVFVFRRAARGVGPIGPRAVADFGAYHEFIGRDTQYRFDGVNVTEINSHFWREMLRTQDPLRTNLVFSHFDDEHGDLIWSFPRASDPESSNPNGTPVTAAVEHYLEDVPQGTPTPFSLRKFPFLSSGYYERKSVLTWDQLTVPWSSLNFRWNDQFFLEAFPFTLVGGADGKVHTLNTSQTEADGTPLYPNYVTFGKRPVVDGRHRGLIKRVYPFTPQRSSAINVVVRLYDAAGQTAASIEEFPGFSQDPAEGAHFVSVYRRGRFFDIGILGEDEGTGWELEGYDIDVVAGGYR